MTIHIFCDGSAAPNPGPGGFGVIAYAEKLNVPFISGTREEVGEVLKYAHFRAKGDTTNNAEELKALIIALIWAHEDFKGHQVLIHTDSAYTCNIYNSWMHSWKNNGWTRGKKKEPIENLALVMKIESLYHESFVPTKVVKCAGHTYKKAADLLKANWGNEVADALATDNQQKLQDFGFYELTSHLVASGLPES